MNFKTIDLSASEKIYKCEFKSIDDLLTAIQASDINTNIFDLRKLYSDIPGPNSLSKTKDLNEAIDLCRYGVKREELKDFVKLNEYIENILPNFMSRRNVVHNLYGYRPDVYKYLNGNPNSMYQLKRNTPKKTINVLVQPNFGGSILRKTVLNFGISVIQLVKLLEMAGYLVSVYYLDTSRQWDTNNDIMNRQEEFILYEVMIKDYHQKINPVSAYFPLCRYDFISRIIFRLIETLPLKIKDWSKTYGNTVANIRDYLPYFSSYNSCDKQIVIDSLVIKNINGKDLISCFKEILDFVNFQDYLVEDQKREYQKGMKKIIKKRG